MSAASLAINTRIRSTPYSARVIAAGAGAYSVYNHMLLPLAFRPAEENYWHLKRHVQVWDVSCQRQVEIRGTDAARLVQLMTPRDLSAAAVGQCLYAPLVDAAGGMINDPIVIKLTEDRFWLSIADSDVLLWAAGLGYGLGLDVTVGEPDVSPLAIQGPRSDDLMANLFGDDVRTIRFFRSEIMDFRGHPLLVARSGWSKQGGFEIYLDEPSLAHDLWDAAFEAGRDLEVAPGHPNAIERIEGGLLSYGGDMTREHNPFECGLDAFCHVDRDIEFIGRDALRRIAAEGVSRRIVGLRIDATELPLCTTRWPVHADGREVGGLSSVAVSPRFGCGVGLAMLDRDYWTPAQKVSVHAPDGEYSASVSRLPFDDPD